MSGTDTQTPETFQETSKTHSPDKRERPLILKFTIFEATTKLSMANLAKFDKEKKSPNLRSMDSLDDREKTAPPEVSSSENRSNGRNTDFETREERRKKEV